LLILGGKVETADRRLDAIQVRLRLPCFVKGFFRTPRVESAPGGGDPLLGFGDRREVEVQASYARRNNAPPDFENRLV
jgi:hypothetical protein